VEENCEGGVRGNMCGGNIQGKMSYTRECDALNIASPHIVLATVLHVVVLVLVTNFLLPKEFLLGHFFDLISH